MITIPDYPWLVKRSHEKQNFREVFERLAEVVKSTLKAEDKIYVRLRREFIAWKRYRDSGQWDHYFCWLTCYNEFTVAASRQL